MTDKPPPTSDPEELWARCQALDEQLRRLVKTEQRLFVLQRDLSRQLGRFDALDRFAVGLGAGPEPSRILEHAADLVFSIFPFDQCVGFVRRADGMFEVAAVRSVLGRVADSAERFAEHTQPRVVIDAAAVPPWCIPAEQLRREHPEVAPLLDGLDALFDSGGQIPESQTPAMVLPIVEAAGAPLGYLVFRRLTSTISYHEELPAASDVPFMQLLSQQVAAALTHARLVADLKRSYEMLAKAQSDLVVRERLAALGELAAVVAHEVRNPVAVIFNSLSTLDRIVAPNEQATALLGIVREEADRLNHMVSDLIDFAKPNPPRFRPESLESVVRDAVENVRTVAGTTSIEVEVQVDGTVPPVRGDGRMLRQIVVNLMSNARHATTDSRPIMVAIRSVADGDRQFVDLEVSDHGVGIEATNLEHIFEPFFTTKPTGSGLGLAVVRRFAELHDGSVSVHSAPGLGTTFKVRLPAAM